MFAKAVAIQSHLTAGIIQGLVTLNLNTYVTFICFFISLVDIVEINEPIYVLEICHSQIFA